MLEKHFWKILIGLLVVTGILLALNIVRIPGYKVTEEKTAPAEILLFGRLDINSAGLKELEALPGIGKKTAEKIIAYREKLKGFKSVEQLKEVEGISVSKYDRIKLKVTVKKI